MGSDDDGVVFFRVADLVQAPVGDDVGFFELKLPHVALPVFLERRGDEFGEELDVELKRRDVVAEVRFFLNLPDLFRQDRDPFLPETVELAGCKLDVIEVVKEDVELLYIAS